MTENSSSPYLMAVLGACDEGQSGAAASAEPTDRRETWRGLAFRVNGAPLVVAIDDVEEVIRYPRVSRVPGAPTWLHGLASWRGRPLVLVGLSQYLGGENVGLARATRVLVVRRHTPRDSIVGIVVDRVDGLRLFADAIAAVPDGDATSWIRPWVSYSRQLDDESWGVLELTTLFGRPEFTHAFT